jgi:hypothetical protein
MEVSGQLHVPAALLPRDRDPGTDWIGGWVGPRAVLDAVMKLKIHSPCRESNLRIPSLVAIPTELPGPVMLNNAHIMRR